MASCTIHANAHCYLCTGCDVGCNTCQNCNRCNYCNNGYNSCSGCYSAQSCSGCNSKQVVCSTSNTIGNDASSLFPNPLNYNSTTGTKISPTTWNNIFTLVNNIKSKYSSYYGTKPFASWTKPTASSGSQPTASQMNAIVANAVTKGEKMVYTDPNNFVTKLKNVKLDGTLCRTCNTGCNVTCNTAQSGCGYAQCGNCYNCDVCDSSCQSSCNTCNFCDADCYTCNISAQG